SRWRGGPTATPTAATTDATKTLSHRASSHGPRPVPAAKAFGSRDAAQRRRRQRRASHPSRTSVRPATPSTVRAKGGEAGATQNRAAKGMRARVRAFGTAAASSWSHGLIDGHVRAGRREGHRRFLGGGSVLELFLRTML